LLRCVSLALATAAAVSWFAAPGIAPASTALMISIAEQGSLQIPYFAETRDLRLR
jgi:hypothetical protein